MSAQFWILERRSLSGKKTKSALILEQELIGLEKFDCYKYKVQTQFIFFTRHQQQHWSIQTNNNIHSHTENNLKWEIEK